MLKNKEITQKLESHDNIKKENDFKNFLYDRKMSYAKDVFDKYSDNELFKKGKSYLPYNRDEVSLQEIILYIISPIIVALSIFATYHMKIANFYTGNAMTCVLLMVFISLVFSVGIVSSSFFRKFIFKKWLKNHYDELLNHFIKDLPVGQDVLKRFVDVYGKEDVAIMMSEKNHLTCGDIFSYVNDSKNKKEIKKQRENLNEALEELVLNK